MIYLRIVACGMMFFFINPVFSAIYNGMGDSKTPFKVNSIGLVLNIILDPILIFGLGPFPKLGAAGAGIATVFSQFVVTSIFVVMFTKKEASLLKGKPILKFDSYYLRSILKVGLPVSVQFASFATFSILVARIIAKWGPVPIAVQKVGIHIEAVSWATAVGFSAAIAAFVGQNFGAKKWERILKGYWIGIGTISIIGILASVGLIIFARPIFRIFIPEEEAVRYGVVYLRILGLSQLFLCWEITTEGAFRGIGRTIPVSIISILFTGMRVPLAMLLSSESLLGLNGVWWSISISTIIKGIILVIGFVVVLRNFPEIKNSNFGQKINPFKNIL